MYEKLTTMAEGHRELGIEYKYCNKSKKYYLPGDFGVEKGLFDNLFDH